MSLKITDVTVTKIGGQDCSLAGVLRQGEENNIRWWRLEVWGIPPDWVCIRGAMDVEINGGEIKGRIAVNRATFQSGVSGSGNMTIAAIGDGKLHGKEKTMTKLEQAAAEYRAAEAAFRQTKTDLNSHNEKESVLLRAYSSAHRRYGEAKAALETAATECPEK